jgi:acetyl esterase/lipase
MLAMMPKEDFRKQDLKALRAGMAAVMAPAPVNDEVTVTERYVPGPDCAPEVRVLVYEPKVKTGDARPGVLYIHGGGYILGTPEMMDPGCRKISAEIDCVVVSVDYRLAPEHPFPDPLEDCYAALKWFSENAPTLGVDPANIAVVGASAGGGLTAGLCLLARDRKGPPIVFQAPLCPMIDDRNITPSSYEITDPRTWSREKNLFGWEAYLGPAYQGQVSAYAAPAREEDLKGLPPLYTYVGELDLFRDETIDYCARLLRAGVPAELHVYPGCFHAFEMFTQVCEVSRRTEAEFMTVLKKALKK